MKIAALIFATILFAANVFGEYYGQRSIGASQAARQRAESERQQAAYAEQQNANQQRIEMEAARQAELNSLYSKDPWRRFGNTTNLNRGVGWVEFQGEVQEIRSGGIILKGKFGVPLTITHLNFYGNDIFFVANFPYPAECGRGFQQMMALSADYYSYTNKVGQSVTIPALNYGTPCVKLWTADELSASKKAADEKKQTILNRVLKSNQEAADKGDVYGLLRMGERYRDGEGVEKDLVKAKNYLQRAATAGSPTAADALNRLPQ